MNHQVPEMMFSTDESPAHGISAVKAIAIASAEGQRIWIIDQNNWHLAQNALNLPADTMQDIRNAVHAGKVVTTHEEQILFHGWVGEGYIILDPETGGGAYMIAGGGNGSETPSDVLGTLVSALMSLMSLGMDFLSALADSGGEVARFFGRIFSLIGVAMDVTDVYTACGDTPEGPEGDIALAVGFTIMMGMLSMAVKMAIANPFIGIIVAAVIVAFVMAVVIRTIIAHCILRSSGLYYRFPGSHKKYVHLLDAIQRVG